MLDHLQHHLSTVLRDGEPTATTEGFRLVNESPFRGLFDLVNASPFWGLFDQVRDGARSPEWGSYARCS